mmetsp:Transcript_19464/g.39690  ORF Transcript_19464/g.39690 Transcript_19464/m.39690 type:complete len:81 (+) Transcript_19464:784-1026(+)
MRVNAVPFPCSAVPELDLVMGPPFGAALETALVDEPPRKCKTEGEEQVRADDSKATAHTAMSSALLTNATDDISLQVLQV